MTVVEYICCRCLGRGHASGDLPMVGVRCLRCHLVDDVHVDDLVVLEMEVR